MSDGAVSRVDVAILGGGIAGLWILDECRRAGLNAVVLEKSALGTGQSLWSQGIIHGGLKYTLSGLLNPSAQAVREMPGVWRRCLAGEIEPDLRGARLRAPFCHLWRTDSIASRAAMIGAKVGLRVTPTDVAVGDRPAALRGVPGVVARLEEQVIDVGSVLGVLAGRNVGRVLLTPRVRVLPGGAGGVRVVLDGERAGSAVLEARWLVLSAGGGNAGLREALGLEPGRTQVRPLHQAMVRGGSLGELNGHCVDGAETRVTVTSARDAAGRVVWQVGGRLAEAGVALDEAALVESAKRELAACLPGVDFSGCEWCGYRADRAEFSPGGRGGGLVRPDDATVLVEGRVISAWPTKLALAPRLAEMVLERVSAGRERASDALPAWAAAAVGAAPWDEAGRVWRG
ncbi:MAG: FAD-dependent oxidoreductase [Phycisphaerales bacterium]